MYPFVEVKNVVKTPQYEVVERFVKCEFWQPENADLFAENAEIDFPHAVPGFLQHLNPFEFKAFCDWLQKTVKNHHQIMEPSIIPTTNPDVFWTIRFVGADVYWAKREGKFECEFVSYIKVQDGKIVKLEDHGNPVSFYKAIGVILPNFNYLYDIVDNAENTRMEAGVKSHFTPEENKQRAINNFANPINGHDEDPESIYAADLVEVNPFVPNDMPEVLTEKDFDIQCDWMFKSVPEWNTPEKIPFYQSVDPNIIIVESFGYGHALWSNCDGHYHQREIQIVHLNDEGKVDHFRVYFNCMNKFYSMNQMIPAFPYLNY